MKITQEELKKYLHYCPETGIFRWKMNTVSHIKIGQEAGSFDSSTGYIRIRINKNQYYAHRLAFLYMEGYIPENQVDHINRIRNDNRWNNLREVSCSCNLRNCKISTNNTSGISGVTWNSYNNKWKSKVIDGGVVIFLGYFENKLDAAKARWEAEKKYGFEYCCSTSSAYLYLKEKGEI